MADADQIRLVVLDRDGVINRESPDFIRRPEEWIPLPGQHRGHRGPDPRGLHRGGGQQPVRRRPRTVHGRDAGGDPRPHDRSRRSGRRPARRHLFLPAPPRGRLRVPEAAARPAAADRGALRDHACRARRRSATPTGICEAAWRVGARAILVRTGNGRETERRLEAGAAVEVFRRPGRRGGGTDCGEPEALILVRSVLFTLLMSLSVLPWSIVVVIGRFVGGYPAAYGLVVTWVRGCFWLLDRLCHLNFRVEGAENIPAAEFGGPAQALVGLRNAGAVPAVPAPVLGR